MEKAKCEICGKLIENPIEFICFRFGNKYFDTCNGRVRKITIMCKTCFRRMYESRCMKCRFNWRPGLPTNVDDLNKLISMGGRSESGASFRIREDIFPMNEFDVERIKNKRIQISPSIICLCTGYIWTVYLNSQNS